MLRLDDLTRHFGGIPAVDGVDLDVEPGSITALIGPNGAGKSTVLRTIAGLHAPTRGRVLLGDREITGLAPHRVRRAGIATVLQDPRPGATGTVLEDATLGAMFGTPGGRRRHGEALEAARSALAVVGLDVAPDRPVATLTVHERRSLDLARALAGVPRVLLLDEVMAGATPEEVAATVELLRGVRDRSGVTVLWVEHVVGAVRALADRVVVLDRGRVLAAGPPDRVVEDPAVVEAYLGDLRAPVERTRERAGPPAAEVAATAPPPVLEVVGVSAGPTGVDVVHDVSLTVAPGEVVAVVGANGAGKTTLLSAIGGLLPVTAGRVLLDGRDASGAPAHRVARAGVGHVPAERHLFPRMTVAENLLLGAYPGTPGVDARDEVLALFPVLGARLEQRAGTLSGGEQRMLAIARALVRRPRVLLLDEPTTGLAPQLADEVLAALGALRAAGVAVLLAEQHVRAALTLADRGHVLDRGRVVASDDATRLLADDRVRRAYLGGT